MTSTRFIFASGKQGFSLVEVVMAIGIVSFSMLTILALLPVGLINLKEVADRDGTTQIIQQVRSDLDQISFVSTGTSGVAIGDLSGQTEYYTRSGLPLPDINNAYFQASFDVLSPSFPGATTSIATTSRTVTVKISYPVNAPNPKTKVFSLLITKQ